MSPLISVIIPTKNRPELLNSLITKILEFGLKSLEIIVVDSSDEPKQSLNLMHKPNVKYILTTIKSAAIQRNIGIENAKNSKFIFFLDDDVFPDESYFEKCLTHLKREEVIGVSGLAVSEENLRPRVIPSGLIGLFQSIFLLDSKQDGVVLKSGINIPVRNLKGKHQAVDWLIGCSAWKVKFIGKTRFEQDFVGQSLGEDVIFSIRMGRKGQLITDPKIYLKHFESDIERPRKQEFWRMWVANRKRLIEVAEFGIVGNLAFWWSNIGQIIILFYSKLRNPRSQDGAICGLLLGCKEVLKGKN